MACYEFNTTSNLDGGGIGGAGNTIDKVGIKFTTGYEHIGKTLGSIEFLLDSSIGGSGNPIIARHYDADGSTIKSTSSNSIQANGMPTSYPTTFTGDDVWTGMDGVIAENDRVVLYAASLPGGEIGARWTTDNDVTGLKRTLGYTNGTWYDYTNSTQISKWCEGGSSSGGVLNPPQVAYI